MAVGLSYLFLANATESALLKPNNILWILFVMLLLTPTTNSSARELTAETLTNGENEEVLTPHDTAPV